MRKLMALIFMAILFMSNTALAVEPTLQKAPRDENGRFYNPWSKKEHSFLDFLRWRLSGNQYAEEKKKEVSFEVKKPDFAALEKTGRDYIVWLGHSTVLIKAAGKRILTDPVFWDVNFLIKRKTPFPIPPEEIPPIDYVLISHAHYDHMNTESLRFLAERDGPLFITGPGYGEYFQSISGKNVALNWTEEYEAGELRITSLPSQHWSKRGLFDTDRMLWCSFLIESGGKKYYWVGDTGFFRGFKEIGERWGPIDVAMVPIGSYEPRWFMKENHLNPEEAVKLARDVRAKVTIPIHWGTFDLSDEPLELPVKRLKEILTKEKNHPVINNPAANNGVSKSYQHGSRPKGREIGPLKKFKILAHGGHYMAGE